MLTPTTDSFVGFVKQSGLIEEGQLAAWLAARAEVPTDSAALGAALCDAGLLTPWQLEKLLAGRYRGFFLGNYKILRQLGAGAMGNVFLAEHRIMRHRVALKVLNKRLGGKEQYLARFQQEARAAATVNHPGIVRAFDVDTSSETAYLVMEYVEGEDLQKIVERDGALPVLEAAECIRQTAEALAAAHAAGLVHRDIKPSNLLLDKAGQVHILDLGLARLSDEAGPSLTLLQDAKMIGTVDYLSPEQARNSHHVDARSDIYSLGCTLYFLLTAQPPFNEGTLVQRVLMHQNTPPRPLRELRSDVPPELVAICNRMVAKFPEERFQSAAELAQSLAFIGSTQPAGKSLVISHRSLSAAGSSAGSRLGTGRGSAHVDTIANHQASSSTDGTSSQSASLAGLELEMLADDDALVSTPPPVPKPPPPVPQTPQPVVPKQPRPASGSGIAKAKPPAQPVAKVSPASQSLTEFDELFSAALSSIEQKASTSNVLSNPGLEPAGSNPSGILAAQIMRNAAQDRTPQPQTLHDRLLSLVATTGDGPGGLSYSLWFLILFGVVTGLVIAGIGFSVVNSTKQKEAIRMTRES